MDVIEAANRVLAPFGLLAWRPDGRVDWASANLEPLLGIAPRGAIGRPLSELLGPELAAHLSSAPAGSRHALHGGATTGRVRTTADGSRLLELLPAGSGTVPLALTEHLQRVHEAESPAAVRRTLSDAILELTGFSQLDVLEASEATPAFQGLRVIEDLERPLVALLHAPDAASLDLRGTALRAPSSVELDWLREDRTVRATLSLPIPAAGTRPLTLRAHHPLPRELDGTQRAACEALQHAARARLSHLLHEQGASEVQRQLPTL